MKLVCLPGRLCAGHQLARRRLAVPGAVMDTNDSAAEPVTTPAADHGCVVLVGYEPEGRASRIQFVGVRSRHPRWPADAPRRSPATWRACAVFLHDAKTAGYSDIEVALL